jgi:hypothetical protein
MLGLLIVGREVPRNRDGSSRSHRHHAGFFSDISKGPRVDVLAGKALDVQRQIEVFRVGSMQQSNRKSIVKELRIDAITSIDGS